LRRNRFYIGEVVYRGKTHPGEHEPIPDRALFEAVQAKLANQAVARTLRLKGSSVIMAGRLFDDCSNRIPQRMLTSAGFAAAIMSLAPSAAEP